MTENFVCALKFLFHNFLRLQTNFEHFLKSIISTQDNFYQHKIWKKKKLHLLHLKCSKIDFTFSVEFLVMIFVSLTNRFKCLSQWEHLHEWGCCWTVIDNFKKYERRSMDGNEWTEKNFKFSFSFLLHTKNTAQTLGHLIIRLLFFFFSVNISGTTLN